MPEQTPHHDKDPKVKTIQIVINGTPHEVQEDDITYERVTQLAFPGGAADVIYSVVYRKAKGGHGGNGTLAPGASVSIKKGTSFDVTATTRS